MTHGRHETSYVNHEHLLQRPSHLTCRAPPPGQRWAPAPSFTQARVQGSECTCLVGALRALTSSCLGLPRHLLLATSQSSGARPDMTRRRSAADDTNTSHPRFRGVGWERSGQLSNTESLGPLAKRSLGGNNTNSLHISCQQPCHRRELSGQCLHVRTRLLHASE